MVKIDISKASQYSVSPQNLSRHLEKLADELIALMQRFGRYVSELGDGLDKLWEQSLELFRREAEFVFTPSPLGSMDLDEQWNDWANQLIQRLTIANLPLRSSGDKQFIQDFLDARSVARAKQLP